MSSVNDRSVSTPSLPMLTTTSPMNSGSNQSAYPTNGAAPPYNVSFGDGHQLMMYGAQQPHTPNGSSHPHQHFYHNGYQAVQYNPQHVVQQYYHPIDSTINQQQLPSGASTPGSVRHQSVINNTGYTAQCLTSPIAAHAQNNTCPPTDLAPSPMANDIDSQARVHAQIDTGTHDTSPRNHIHQNQDFVRRTNTPSNSTSSEGAPTESPKVVPYVSNQAIQTSPEESTTNDRSSILSSHTAANGTSSMATTNQLPPQPIATHVVNNLNGIVPTTPAFGESERKQKESMARKIMDRDAHPPSAELPQASQTTDTNIISS